MKTEQEQIKAIKQIIDERVETTLGQVQGRHDNVIKTVDTVIIARDIVEAGYGDVSEYKAEIERLKSNNGFLQCVISHSKDMMDEAVKQAQIDVLNKVKTLIFQKDNPYNVPFEEFISANVFCGYIDELIKEVEAK